MTVYGRRCFYCFVFIFVASGTRHGTGQQFKLKTGPWERVCRLSYPRTVTFFVVVWGQTASEGIFAKAFCLYMGSSLYISIVFNSITLNPYFLFLFLFFLFFIVDYLNYKKTKRPVNPDPVILSLKAGTGYPGDRSSCRVQPRTLYLLITSVSI